MSDKKNYKLSPEEEEIIARFERATRDAANVQRETLRRILDENAGVEYLNGLGLAGLTDADDVETSFRARVPVVTHADVEPYIQRIADGDASAVLTVKPVTAISLSSGTTQGKRKYLLFNDELLQSATQFFLASIAFTNREFPVENGKVLEFMYGSRQETTNGGLTATTVMTNLLRSKEFMAAMRSSPSSARPRRCSPDEVVFSPDFDESLYCHLLCGLLLADDVRLVSASFAHTIVVALQTLERMWRELCHDIRHGAVSPSRVTTPAVRDAVDAILAAPNPELADALERRCAVLSENNWYGLIPAMWPNARYVTATMTGSMEHYVSKLRHYAGGSLPLVAGNYASTEGVIGINVEQHMPPESVVFAVVPDAAYFEFIPLKPAGSGYADDGEPVGLTDVAVGERYEVVVTTFTGLYRYRLGDVVKVTGFHHATPKVKFICRRSLILSINIDKNSEQDLQLAVDSAAKILAGDNQQQHRQLEIVDYTSHADTSTDPGHYVVFWELNGNRDKDDDDDGDDGVLQRCCDEIDRAFADAGYVLSRKTRAIGALELRVVRKGTFQEVLRHYVAGGNPAGQFKLPRCVPRYNAGVLRMMEAEEAEEETIARFERTMRDAANVQRETLRRIIDENAGVEYLRGLGLDELTDVETTFRARVPVVTHTDLEPYIQRIADGDTSPVLTAKPVTAISVSSGTTQGKRKYLLFNDERVKSSIQASQLTCAFTNKDFPVKDGKALVFVYSGRETKTKGGLTATTVLTNLFRSEAFNAAAVRMPRPPSCTPRDVVALSTDYDELLYLHLLCGFLFADEVSLVSAVFAHSLVVAFQTLESVWRELCHDIRHGAVSPSRVATPAVRKSVDTLLAAPNPALADALERRCDALSVSSWSRVIPAIWPNARYVEAIMTGSMEHYVSKLRHYAGGVPLIAGKYASSEGIIGLNVDLHDPPESVAFTVLPDAAYFEFIPLKPAGSSSSWCYADADDAEPVGLTDVAVGEHYEVVMTTFTGLYRYRMGDVVKVDGFYGSTPKLKFVCRRNVILSINVDKNSELDLHLAVNSAAKILISAADDNEKQQLEVADYTSYADMSSDPGHYVIFWELSGRDDDDTSNQSTLPRCCDELDRAFADEGYVQSRKTRAIGPLELRILRRGTFQEVLRHYVAGGSSAGQFKLPRCIARSNAGLLGVLSGNTITGPNSKKGRFGSWDGRAELRKKRDKMTAVKIPLSPGAGAQCTRPPESMIQVTY
uniref:Uncharacterized protein n=1 Tax=Leersia perrieri TaxID=77586 RepID=A0A0D9XPW1_9ORYZ